MHGGRGGRPVAVGGRDPAHHAHAAGEEEDRVGERGRTDRGDAEGAQHARCAHAPRRAGRAASSRRARESRSAGAPSDAVAPAAGRPRSPARSRDRAAPRRECRRSPCARRRRRCARSDRHSRWWMASTLLSRNRLISSRPMIAPAPATPAGDRGAAPASPERGAALERRRDPADRIDHQPADEEDRQAPASANVMTRSRRRSGSAATAGSLTGSLGDDALGLRRSR